VLNVTAVFAVLKIFPVLCIVSYEAIIFYIPCKF